MQITELINIVILLASLITAVVTICKFIRKAINKGFEPVYRRIDRMDLEHSKNYLTEFLADVKNGINKDENQIARANEVYDYYTNALKGNSYIHTSWEKLMKRR